MAPIYLLRPSCVPWTGGVISLTAVVDRLKDLLPPTFEDLNTVRSYFLPAACQTTAQASSYWPAGRICMLFLSMYRCPVLCTMQTRKWYL